MKVAKIFGDKLFPLAVPILIENQGVDALFSLMTAFISMYMDILDQ